MSTCRLMLLDTASLYFRAFHGLPTSIQAPDGRPVNAVRGLLDFIARLVTSYRPTHLVACWDNDWRPQWRVELLPSYKTHRVAEQSAHEGTPVAGSRAGIAAEERSPASVGAGVRPCGGAGLAGAASGVAETAPDELAHQVPLILDVLEALGMAVAGADGYEADDVIGTLQANSPFPVDVVTGDRDLFQLVSERVRVIYTARGMSQLQEVDDAWLRERYAITGEQYADFAVLRGDPSDGIPGVAGIGEKSASALLARYGDLSGLLQAAMDPGSDLTKSQRSKLVAAAGYLEVAPRVVRVACDIEMPVPIEGFALPGEPADTIGFQRFSEELGLGSSAQRIVAALHG